MRRMRGPKLRCEDDCVASPWWDVVAAVAGSVAMVAANVAAHKLFPELYEPAPEKTEEE